MFPRLIRWAGLVCGTWYEIVNDRTGVRKGGEMPVSPLEIGFKNQLFLEKADVGILNSDY